MLTTPRLKNVSQAEQDILKKHFQQEFKYNCAKVKGSPFCYYISDCAVLKSKRKHQDFGERFPSR